MVRAKSARLSRQPRPTSWAGRNRLCPPSCITADSKLTRVRNDGFSNTRPTIRLARVLFGSRRAWAALRRIASPRILTRSSLVTSVKSVKCRMRNSGLTRVRQDRFFKDGAALVEQFVGQVKRGKEADDGLVGAVDQQSSLQAALDHVGPRHRQFDADHDALDPHRANDGAASLECFEAFAKAALQHSSSFQQAIGLDRLDGGQGGAAGDW